MLAVTTKDVETLTSLYGEEVACAIMHPALSELVTPKAPSELRGEPNHDASFGFYDITLKTEVRRALLIGSSDRSSRKLTFARHTDQPQVRTTTEFDTATPMDHLGVVLGGRSSINPQCPDWMTSHSARGILASWAMAGHYQRKPIGLDYIVNHLDPNDGGFNSRYKHYLKELPFAANGSDLTLVVIEGNTIENASWEPASRSVDKEFMMDSLARTPGWKFIVDLSVDSHVTLDCWQSLACAKHPQSEKIGVLVADRSPVPREAHHAGFGHAPGHNQSVWDYFLNSLLFYRGIESYSLRDLISVNCDFPKIPAIQSYFSVKL